MFVFFCYVLFRAQQSLADVYQQVSLAKLSQPQITFAGLSHFKSKVLYMNPVKYAHLDVVGRIAGTVSYTHRELYKKQLYECGSTLKKGETRVSLVSTEEEKTKSLVHIN